VEVDQEVWIADTHVHLYENFDLGKALTAAVRNFRAVPMKPGLREASGFLLYLTERSDTSYFSQLPEAVGRSSQFSLKELTGSYAKIECDDGVSFFIVRGFQTVSQERMEVLGLVMEARPPEGLPLRELAAWIRTYGGVPVIPWSPGKWWGQRGKVLRSYLASHESDGVLLGDVVTRSASRALGMGLGRARDGRRILYGSDPFPLPLEEGLVGSAVTIFAKSADDGQGPSVGLPDLFKQILQHRPIVGIFGARLSLVAVVHRILRLKLLKYSR